jgi:hypothetical protein
MDILRAIRTSILFRWINPLWSSEHEAYTDIKRDVRKKSAKEIERRMNTFYGGSTEEERPSRTEELKILKQFKLNFELFKSLGKDYDLGGYVIDPSIAYTHHNTYFRFTIFDALEIEMTRNDYIYVYLNVGGNRKAVRYVSDWKREATDDIKDLYYEALEMIDKFNREYSQEEVTRDVISDMKNKYYARKFDESFEKDLNEKRKSENKKEELSSVKL